MAITTNCYPDNFRRGIPGSPENGPRNLAKMRKMDGFYPSLANSQATADEENLFKIGKILRAAAKDIEPLVASLNFANTAVDRRYGMKALDLGADLPALAEEIERDDVEHAQKAAECV